MNNRLKRWALSAMVAILISWAVALLLDIFNDWHGLLYVGVMMFVGTAAGNFCFNFLAHWHDERLTTRVKAVQPVIWNVSMNNVEIGKVTDSQYRAMQRTAFRDGRLLLAQFFNLCRVVLVVVEKSFVTVPLLIFWLTMALAIFSPESYMDMMREFQKADSEAIMSAAHTILRFGLTVMFAVVVIMITIGYRFGFRNLYSEAVNRMLRQHCNTPAYGDVQLFATPSELSPVNNDQVARQ